MLYTDTSGVVSTDPKNFRSGSNGEELEERDYTDIPCDKQGRPLPKRANK